MTTGNTQPVDKQRVRQITQSTWIDDYLLAPATVQAGLVVILVLTFLRTWILLPGVFATSTVTAASIQVGFSPEGTAQQVVLNTINADLGLRLK
ncbi:hypothetical protein ACP061_004459 [Salmonella enterica subsp. enterica serovar Norwich]